LAKKLSDLDALPAFVLPRYGSEWNASLRSSNVTKIVDTKPSEREFSILGGGDLGFPLLLVSSTYFGYGLTSALIISGFSIVGLIAAYGIQLYFLKGKPVPGLPPIAVMCLIGLMIVRFVYL